MAPTHRIGVDENGLGAWLGPLIVTGVLAQVGGRGADLFGGSLPPDLARDLGDSKRLVSHADARLGEAWARALVSPAIRSPAELIERLSLEGTQVLRSPCPGSGAEQCWSTTDERFVAPDDLVDRVRRHRDRLADLELDLLGVKSSIICVRLLNLGRARQQSRFVLDLHAMERIVLALREQAGTEIHAVCGKVGAMSDYSRFFGPLGGRLHSVLQRGARCSAYRFPGLGEVQFVQDADDSDPMVMLASLVGKYLRELLMGRIARSYPTAFGGEPPPSGYHDPRTARFVRAANPLRRQRRVPRSCFERAREHGN